MPLWKRILLRAAGFGAGSVVIIAIVAALLFWYNTRPVKPKPWNRAAITADYYRVLTADQPDSNLQFEYVLENKTDKDYELQKYSAPKIAAKLEDTNCWRGLLTRTRLCSSYPFLFPLTKRRELLLARRVMDFRPLPI